MTLIVEATLRCDFGHRQLVGFQQVARNSDADFTDVVVWRDAETS
jgi:hypothetical protein